VPSIGHRKEKKEVLKKNLRSTNTLNPKKEKKRGGKKKQSGKGKNNKLKGPRFAPPSIKAKCKLIIIIIIKINRKGRAFAIIKEINNYICKEKNIRQRESRR